jgi:hypothetical protein
MGLVTVMAGAPQNNQHAAEEQARDEILRRLLHTPPQPRPKRDRSKGDSVPPKRDKPKKQKTPDK